MATRISAMLPLIVSHGLIHGLSASLPALLPLIMEEFNLNYTEVGILSFSLGASLGIMSVVTGIISDIMKDKLLNLLGYSLLFTGIFAFFVIFMHNYIALLIFMMIQGFLLSFYHPLALSYIAIRFSSDRGRVFGMHETGANLGLASAPAIAGFLAPHIGWRLSYAILAMPAVISALFILCTVRAMSGAASGDVAELRMRNSLSADGDGGRCDGCARRAAVCDAICDAICDEFRDFMHRMRSGVLRRLYIAEGVFGFVVGGASTFIPLYLVAEGFSVAFAGLMTGVFLAFGAIGKYLGGIISDILGGISAVSFGFLLAAPLFLAVPLMPFKSLALLLLVLAGMTFPMALSAIIASISAEMPQSRTGIAFGFMMLAGFGFGSISRPILGFASDMIGVHSVFFIIGVVSLLGGIIMR